MARRGEGRAGPPRAAPPDPPPSRAPARIPHSRPTRAPGDLEAAARVLESGQLAAGPEVRALEEEAARACGRRWAAATSSGLAALHLGLLALEARPGDGIAMPSWVCTALLNAARYVEAREALADCAPDSFNLDPKSPALEGARIVIAPHLLGFPAPMPRLLERARAAGARVIEDCAMAAGAEAAGRPAGGWGDLAVFSLYATKMASCGQGGLLLGDDPALEERVRDLLAYDNRDDYRVRYNYQLTDLQAAVARRQWAALPGWVERRREIAARYSRSIDLPGRGALGGDADGGRPCFYRYPLDFGSAALRDRVARLLEDERIEAKRPVYRPLHRYLGLPDCDFPRASRLQDGVLSLPIYPSLTDAEADRVASAVNRAVRACGPPRGGG